MTTEHQTTQLEEAYWQLLDGAWETLSESARTVLENARSVSYAANMAGNYSVLFDCEDDETMDRMRLAATAVTDRDQELLTKIWRAALAAAASVDPDDFETLAGHRVNSGHLHLYYRMLSDMVEKSLSERRHLKMEAERQKEFAEPEPVDRSACPF